MSSRLITILDGPVGTQLAEYGVDLSGQRWSADAIDRFPEVISQIHRRYATAGATVHTANTFRTRRRDCGDRWRSMTGQAVLFARQAVPDFHRVAGSIAPLEDCYRPDLAPPDAEPEHQEFADALAAAGCDLLLCETFANVGEACAAVGAAVSTGVETWAALTAGPDSDLLTPVEMAEAARRVVDEGATAVFCNCTAARETLRYVEAMAQKEIGVSLGVYANAGEIAEGIGWRSTEEGANRYADFAKQWIDAGATIIGGCCGTGPEHIAELATRYTKS